jgi:hypothetical protein
MLDILIYILLPSICKIEAVSLMDFGFYAPEVYPPMVGGQKT